MLKRDTPLVRVGALAEPRPSPQVFNPVAGRQRLAASLIGGIGATQAMLIFCAPHCIVSDIELLGIDAAL